jgi:hypothetical protein
VASAEVRCDIWGHAESAETPLGLLITQRSRVQIPPPLLVSAAQGPFRQGEGPLRFACCSKTCSTIGARCSLAAKLDDTG